MVVAKRIRQSVTFDPDDLEWLRSVSDGIPFDSVSHAVRVAVKKMRDEMDDEFSLPGEGEEE